MTSTQSSNKLSITKSCRNNIKLIS